MNPLDPHLYGPSRRNETRQENIKLAIVVDYGKSTIEDTYPIPNNTKVLGKLERCKCFRTLNLAGGFHQIEMAEEDIPKTAFVVEY